MDSDIRNSISTAEVSYISLFNTSTDSEYWLAISERNLWKYGVFM